MIQMQLLVGMALPSVFWLAPIGAVVAGVIAMRLKGESAGDRGRLGRGLAGIGLGVLIVAVARLLPSGQREVANALAIGGAGGCVLAGVALWLVTRVAARGSERGATLVGAALGVLGASGWAWVLVEHGETLGLPGGDLKMAAVALLATCLGAACAAVSVRGGDVLVARGMDAYSTVRCTLAAAAAVAVVVAAGMDELAEGERRTLALRLVACALGVGGVGAAASAIGAGMKGPRAAGIAGLMAIIGSVGVAWLALKGESAMPWASVGLAASGGIAAAMVMGWRRSAGMAVLAVAAAAGWWLLRSAESEAPGLLGVALAAVGFVSIAGVRGDQGEAEAGSAAAGVVLAAGLLAAIAAHQTLAGAALGRQYPAANYRNGQFVGRVDIAGPHGVYVGGGMLALIFPGAGPNNSTVYDGGMIDRTRLEDHVLETLGPGMIFPLSEPGAEEHAGHDHGAEEHAHEDGGHDYNPAAARARVLSMRGEVPHGDHAHSYAQDVIATRHATLGDVLTFHGGGAVDGRLLAGLLAGAGLAACAAACGGVMSAAATIAVSAAVLLLAGPGAACGLVLGMAGASVARGNGVGSAGTALKLAAIAAVVLAGVFVRNGSLLG